MSEFAEIEKRAREIGDLIGAMCERPGKKKYGFALMMFSFEGDEMTWISNSQRADMVRLMQEFIDRNPPDTLASEVSGGVSLSGNGERNSRSFPNPTKKNP